MVTIHKHQVRNEKVNNISHNALTLRPSRTVALEALYITYCTASLIRAYSRPHQGFIVDPHIYIDFLKYQPLFQQQ